MFNIGAGELFIIFLVAFFVVGPKDLPKVVKGVKRFLQTLRNMVKDLKAESGWDDIMKEVSDTREEVTGSVQALDVRKDLREAKKSVEDSVRELDIRRDLEEARSALEKGADSVKRPLQSAAGAVREELGAGRGGAPGGKPLGAEPEAAAPERGASSEKTDNIGPEAKKTEEKK